MVVRTRLPFFKSKPGKVLLAANLFIITVVLLLPFTPIAAMLGFTRQPLSSYGWLLLIITGYMVAAELTKHWFYKKYTTS